MRRRSVQISLPADGGPERRGRPRPLKECGNVRKVVHRLKRRRAHPLNDANVRQAGYREYQKSLMAIPAAERLKFPVAGKGLSLANTGEMQLLINGKHSALDIRKMLDAQNERRSTLQAVLNYLEILKLAGL